MHFEFSKFLYYTAVSDQLTGMETESNSAFRKETVVKMETDMETNLGTWSPCLRIYDLRILLQVIHL